MLGDGLYTRFPKPDFMLALHVINDLPAGMVAYTSGPALASSTATEVTVTRRTAACARHTTVDPIVRWPFSISRRS